MSEIQAILVKDLKMTDRIARFADLMEVKGKSESPLSGFSIDVKSIKDKTVADAFAGVVESLGGTVTGTGEPDYRFAVWSDIHLYNDNSPDDQGQGRGYEDFKTAISAAKARGVRFAAVCGDVGYRRVSYPQTKKYYEDAISATEPNFPISCCTGNHDQYLSETEWSDMTSCNISSYYEISGNDIFFYLQLKNLYPSVNDSSTYGSGQQTNPYEQADINLLSTVMRDNPGKRMFLFTHFPFNAERTVRQYPGLGQEYYGNGDYYEESNTTYGSRLYYYGFKLDSTTHKNEQNNIILNLIKEYDGQVITFNGHSHFQLEVDKWIDQINYAKIAPGKHIFHVPSLNFPRNRAGKTIAENDTINQPSQGYIVNVYEDSLVVEGCEFNLNLNGNDLSGEVIRTYNI